MSKYRVSKVIFAIEADGLFVNEKDPANKKIKLVPEILSSELDNLDLADLGKKIDVTGGIQGKINSIKKICTFNIPVQIVNGLKENNIYKSLKNEKVISTYIKIKN